MTDDISTALRSLPDPPKSNDEFWAQLESAMAQGAGSDVQTLPSRSVSIRPLLSIAAGLVAIAMCVGVALTVAQVNPIQSVTTGIDGSPEESPTNLSEDTTPSTRAVDHGASGDNSEPDVETDSNKNDNQELGLAPETTVEESSSKPTFETDSAERTDDSLVANSSQRPNDPKGPSQSDGSDSGPIGSTTSVSSGSTGSTTSRTRDLPGTSKPEQPTTSSRPATSTTTSSTATSSTSEPDSGQLAAPPFNGPLVPLFSGSQDVSFEIGFDPVPGATMYRKTYSKDGVELSTVEDLTTNGDRRHRSRFGNQYCLTVTALSDSRPDSEPSIVCSVSATAMSPLVSGLRRAASGLASAAYVSWPEVEPARDYRLTFDFAEIDQPVVFRTTETSQLIDLEPTLSNGDYCVKVEALDSEGRPIQAAYRCQTVIMQT